MHTSPADTRGGFSRAVPGGPPGSLFSLTAFAPSRGPRRRPIAAVPVDAELVWVAPLPEAAAGAAHRSSPAALVHLHLLLARELAVSRGDPPDLALTDEELIDAAAHAVAGYLDTLPDLPFVGEPFGGEEGTD